MRLPVGLFSEERTTTTAQSSKKYVDDKDEDEHCNREHDGINTPNTYSFQKKVKNRASYANNIIFIYIKETHVKQSHQPTNTSMFVLYRFMPSRRNTTC